MITCAVTTSFLGCLTTLFLFFRYVFFLDLTSAQKTVWFFVFILLGCLPLLVDYSFENLLGSAYSFYRYSLYFLYIGCVILFTLTVFRDGIWLVLYKTGVAVSPFSKLWCERLNGVTIAAALLMAVYALYAGTKTPEVKAVTLESDKIKHEQTIAVLSDLHIHRTISADKIKKIVQRTNAQNPDVVLLAGDIIDDDVARVAPITALLKNLKANNGIYFVTGNHEFYAGYRETVDELKKIGFSFLENNGLSVNDSLYMAGIPDLSARRYGLEIDVNKAFENSREGQYRLLMSHTPGNFGADNLFDLEISGHTHGGQIFPFHIFVKLYNTYLAGLYDLGKGAKIYVSRGAGQWGPQMRFLAPSEITIIKLVPTNPENIAQKTTIDTVFSLGRENPYSRFFTGKTYLNMLSVNDDVFHAPIGSVMFEPGARTHWHKHSGGQLLLVTAGEGRYQERGKPVRVLNKGDVVRIEPDLEHWHGAAPDSWFSHISIETNGTINKPTWLDPVTDEQYKG